MPPAEPPRFAALLLAHLSHRFRAAAAELPESPASHSDRVQGVRSGTPARWIRRAPRPARHLHALALRIGKLGGLALLTLLPASVDADVAPRAVARLLAASGIGADAERARALYVRALVAADVPDDDDGLALAIRTTFAPGTLRERWVRQLARALEPETLEAAENFYGSVPGTDLSTRLRRVRAALDEADRAARAPALAGNASAGALAAAVGGDAREAALFRVTGAAAAWTAALVSGETANGDPGPWLEAGPAEPPVRVDEALAWSEAAPVYLEGLADFAVTDAGLRFHRACADALASALEKELRARSGTLVRAAARRLETR
jgi:hypothetical protein